MDVPLQPSGNVTLMLHRNHLGTFRKGYTETTKNVLLRFSYNPLGTFPEGYPKTIRERYWGTFMNVWETFHFNVMGTLHGNVFYGFGGTFWERSRNVKLLAGYWTRELRFARHHAISFVNINVRLHFGVGSTMWIHRYFMSQYYNTVTVPIMPEA